MKPQFRELSDIELNSSLTLLIRRVLTDRIFPFKSCLSCKNFIEENEICKLANQRPPARVICYACPKYEDIEELPY